MVKQIKLYGNLIRFALLNQFKSIIPSPTTQTINAHKGSDQFLHHVTKKVNHHLSFYTMR